MSRRALRMTTLLPLVIVLGAVSGGTGWPGDTASLSEMAKVLQQKAGDVGPLGTGGWVGDVFVLPFTYQGSYEAQLDGRLNVEPRQWVVLSFLASNPDTYDFVLVLTQFGFSSEEGVAGFYWSVRNDVSGIGMPVMDLSSEFGSRRLQGIIDGGELAQYLDEDGALDPDRVAVVLNHEIGHRWLARCRFLDDSGETSGALLGRDGAHWSYLLDSDASFLYGSDWRANGDGSFTAVQVMARYSRLDLYLMGMLPPEEVPPLTLLRNEAVDPQGLPWLGDTVEAAASTVTMDRILAAEGPRDPAAADSPRSFAVAVVYLVDPEGSVGTDELDALAGVVTTWRRAFFRHTLGQAVVDAGRNTVPPVSPPEVDIGAAVSWLEQMGQDGIWSGAPGTTVRDTAAAVSALSRFAGSASTVDAGLEALAALQAGSAELVARQVAVLARGGRGRAASALADTLAARVVDGGGWAAFGRYSPDVVTTARVLSALHAAGVRRDLEQQGWTWVLEQQHSDGGWGWRPDGPSAVYPTEEVLLAAVTSRPGAEGEPWVQQALAWLLGGAQEGGFGEPWPDVLQTARFLRLAPSLGVDRTVADAAIAFLAQRQEGDGSWEESIAATAAAVEALAPYTTPDPAVSSAELAVTPERVFEGDDLSLEAAVRNFGPDLEEGFPYRWELVDTADPRRVWAELPGSLPAIPAGGWAALNDSWSPAVPAGSYLLRLVLDPDGVADDGDRSNNTAEVELEVDAHPAGVDLTVLASTVAADPEAVQEVPQALALSLEIENLGLTAASAARIAVFDADHPGSAELASVTVDCPALTRQPVQVPVTLSEARAHTLVVVADPDDLFHDEDRTNNQASRVVPVVPTWDPAVIPGTFQAVPASVTAGDEVTLSAVVSNRGTRALGSFQVAFSYSSGGSASPVLIALLDVEGSLDPGESRTVTTPWRPGALDSPLTLGVEVDPAGAVDDRDRSNNSATASLSIAAGALPDLVAAPQTLSFDPDPADQGSTVTLAAEVLNEGAVPASSFRAEIRLDDSETGPVVAEAAVSDLQPGEAVTLSGAWTMDGPEDRLVYLVADPEGVVEELNEENNQAFRMLDVRSLPDLVLTRAGLAATPGYPRAGEPVELVATVDNLGEQPAPATTVELRGEDGALLGTAQLPALAPGARGSAVLGWTAPAEPQDVTLVLEVNPGQDFAEQRSDNNRAAITLAVQDAGFYVTQRYISPDGDGVQNKVDVFFRERLDRVTVETPERDVVRELDVPQGGSSVVWDGTDARGRVVPDGLYTLRGGGNTAGVVVDTNRLSLLDSASGVLMQQSFLPSQGGELDFGFDPAASPAGAGLFFLHRPAQGPAQLVRSAWGNFTVVGDWPEGVTAPDAATARSDLFLSVNWYDAVTLVRWPGGATDVRAWRQGFTEPGLSPDGRWIVWSSEDGTGLLLESVADPSDTRTFGPFGQPDSGCGVWGPFWSPDGVHGVVVPRLWDMEDRRFYLLDLSGEPTAREVIPDPGPWPFGCYGEGFRSSGGAAKARSEAAEGGELSVNFARGRITYYADQDETLAAYDLQTGAFLGERPVSFPAGFRMARRGLADAGDGAVAEATDDATRGLRWRLLDLEDGAVGRIELGDRYYFGGWLPLDRELLFEPAWDSQTGAATVISSGENLAVDLRPRLLFGNGGISLSVVATDRYLDHFQLEYATAGPSPVFQPLGEPSSERLLGETWGTWLPPAAGRYLLRLTAWDRAGNSRSVTRTVTWDGQNDIANLTLGQRFISPFSSPGVQDSLVLRYLVLRPANLEFEIQDEAGTVVRRLNVAADTTGPATTVWDGTDETGRPVPDGRYSLVYRGATWPFVVDNTPPQLSFEVSEPELRPAGAPGQPAGNNGLVAAITAEVHDANPDVWVFSRRDADGGAWAAVGEGSGELESEGFPFSVVGAGFLTSRELRLEARDRAGNSAEAQRIRRWELLALAPAQPFCGSGENRAPCAREERPPVDGLQDSGDPLSIEDGGTVLLGPGYTGFVIQSTVWGDVRQTLHLRYRRTTAGIPGPWQDGALLVGSSDHTRPVVWTEEVAAGEQAIQRERRAGVALIPVYWDHPGLEPAVYELQVTALNCEGQEVTGPLLRAVPPNPLVLETLGFDGEGLRLRMTNVSRNALAGVRLQKSGDGGLSFTDIPGQVVTLAPGEFAETVLTCELTTEATSLELDAHWKLRAVGFDPEGSALSNTIEAPVLPTVTLITELQPASCASGRETPAGLRFVPKAVAGAEAWSPGGTARVSIEVPQDPTGAAVARYELLVDGAVMASVADPQPGAGTAVSLDLSGLADGTHVLAERYTFDPGQEGILGACARSWPLHVDREPPTVGILGPEPDAVLCPADGTYPVEIECSPDVVSRSLRVDGATQPDLEVDASELSPGAHTLTVEAVDWAGWAACAETRVFVDEVAGALPLQAGPLLFSPVAPADDPGQVQITSTVPVPGDYELEIRPLAGGDAVAVSAGHAGNNEGLDLWWDGRDALGAVVPDGAYRLKLRLTTACGATARAQLPDPDAGRPRPIEVDATPPEAVLTSPGDGYQAGAAVPLAGRVTDPHLASWRVEVREAGDCGDCWVAVAGGSSPAPSLDEPLGAWNTSDFPSGSYLVRLVAEDAASNVTVAGPVTVELGERELIRSFTSAPVVFSPNGDGVADEESLRAELIQDAVLTLTVQDAGGSVVRTLVDHETLGAGYQMFRVWDGRGDGGEALPDGSYVFVLTAEDPASLLQPQVEQTVAVVDTSPPELDLLQPVEDALSGQPLSVVGSVGDPHLERWALTLAGPAGPWRELASASGPVAAREVARIDNLADGPYRLILEGVDAAGNTARVDRSFEVDTSAPVVSFVDPAAGSVLPADQGRVPIRVRVEDRHLAGYELAVAPGHQPEPSDFQVLATGDQTPGGGIVQLAWDAAGLDDGPYTLRAVADDGLGQSSEVRLPLSLDGAAPEVVIQAPADGSVVSSPAEVQGSVQDPNLNRWSLQLLPAEGQALALAAGREAADGRLGFLDPLPADGWYDLVLEAWDAAGHRTETRSRLRVAAAPSAPEGLTATLVGRNDVRLTWTPGPGPEPVAYVLSRDGTPLAETGEPAFTDTSVPDGAHVYTVRARNLAGMESADSEPASITVDASLPTARILDPIPGQRVSGQVTVRGTATRDTGFASYELSARALPDGAVQRLAAGTVPVLAGELGGWETAAFPDGAYRIELEARDGWGGVASDSVDVTVDNTPPQPPVLTEATLGAHDGDGVTDDVHVAWTLDSPPADLAGYYLYRNGRLANAQGVVIGDQTPYLLTGTQFDDADLPDGRYVYTVTAADQAGNESPESNPAEVVIDTRRPHAVFSQPEDGAEVGLTTTLAAEVEDGDVASLDFEYRPASGGSWSPVAAPLTAPPFTATFTAPAPGRYQLRAVAADAVGSDPAPEVITVTATVRPPTPEARVQGSTVTLSWAPLPADGSVQGIWVLRDGARTTASPLDPEATGWEESGLADGTYTYNLTVVDAGGHESGPSEPALATVFAPRFGFVSPVVEAAGTDLSGSGAHHGDLVFLDRRGATGDFAVVASAEAQGDPDSSALTARFAFSAVELAPGLNTFRLRAQSPAGDVSRPSRELVVVRTQAPDAPGGLQASVDQDQVTLTWDPSPAPDAWRYAVRRDAADAVGEAASALSYDPAAHTLTASGGDPVVWAAAVDGDAATGWTAEPVPGPETPAFWQWTWPEPLEGRSLTLTWQPELVWIDVDLDLQVGGVWLWWRSGFIQGPESTLELPPGLQVQGIRLRLESLGEAEGGGTVVPALHEVVLTTVERPAAPPVVDAGVAAGGHTYGVQALSRWGLASPQAEVPVLVGGDPPPAPAGLTATAGPGCGEVTLAWAPVAPPVGDLVAYRVLRAESASGPFELIAVVPPTLTSMVDRFLSPGTTYWYTARAVARVGAVLIQGAAADPTWAEPPCDAVPPPEIDIPTTVGHPLTLAEGTTPIGGWAWPGSTVTLLEDGTPVASATADPLGAGETEVPVEGFDPWDNWPILDAVASTLAYTNWDDTATIVDLANGDSLDVTIDEGWINGLALSPDGTVLALAAEDDTGGTLYLVDATGGDPRAFLAGEPVVSPVFSPDGGSIAVIVGEAVMLVDVPDGNGRELLDGNYKPSSIEAFDPTGRRLLVRVLDTAGAGGWDPGLMLVPLEGSQPQVISLPDDAELAADPFAPDGASLLLERSDTWEPEDMTLWNYDIETGGLVQLSSEPGELSPAWLQPGVLAFLGMDASGHWQLLARGADGRTEVLLEHIDDSLEDDLADGDWPPVRGTGAGWVVLPSHGSIYRVERMGGRFRFPSVALVPGRHVFVARQQAMGELSDSGAVEIHVPEPALPDAEAQGLAALPAAPAPGQPVLIQADVVNTGAAPLEGCGVVLLRLDGATVERAAEWRLDLQPGETAGLRYRWEGLPAAGDSDWRLVADPGGLVAESDESNNEAGLHIPVLDPGTLSVSVALGVEAVTPGQQLAVHVELAASGEPPADVGVETVVEDAEGVQVASLDSRSLPALVGPASFDLAWIVPQVAPGQYQVRALATDSAGRTATAAASLEVTVPTMVTVSVAAERTRYAAGELVTVRADVRNGSAAPLSGLVTLFEARSAADGDLVADAEVPLVAIGPGGRVTVPWPWDTAGVSSGDYTLTCRVLDEGGSELARSAPFAVELTAGPAAVTGQLAVAPSTLEPSGSVTLSAVLSNHGQAAAEDLAIALAVVDPSTWTELMRVDRTLTVPGNGEATATATFPAADLALGRYLAVLLLDGAGEERQLASAAFTVADLSPPALTVLSPQPGPVCGRVEIAVQAVDTLTGVVEVSYGVDGGEQRYPMEMDPLLADSVYRAVWELDATQVGPHELSVVARDRAGNVAGPVTWTIEAVLGGGQLTVDAPGEGSCTPGPVTIVYDFEGGQASELSATLNGEPISSGTSVAEEGAYTLEVRAADACGSETTVTRHFFIDRGAPQVEIGGIPDREACSGEPVTPVITVSDPNLVFSEALLNGQPFIPGTTVTEEGNYLLEVTATDACGNQSTASAAFAIETSPPVIEIDGVEPGDCLESPVTVTFTATDANLAQATATLDGVPYTSGTPITVEGEHTLEVTAADSCGNQASREVSFTIDNDLPVIEVAGVEDGTCTADTVTVDFSATGGALVSVTATLDGADYVSGTPISEEGEHTLVITAVEACGRETRAELGFTIDRTPPRILIEGIEPGGASTDPVILSWTVTDDHLEEQEARLDGEPVTSPVEVTGLGEHLLEVSARDCAGTQAEERLQFSIQASGPPPVTGTLEVTPPDVAAGMPVDLAAHLANGGDDPVEGMTVRLLAEREGGGDPQEVSSTVLSLDPGAGGDVGATLETGGLLPGAYRVRLEASGSYYGYAYEMDLDEAELMVRAPAVPAVSRWGLGLLVFVLGLGGAWMLRRTR